MEVMLEKKKMTDEQKIFQKEHSWPIKDTIAAFVSDCGNPYKICKST
jgi:hypothetical protein